MDWLIEWMSEWMNEGSLARKLRFHIFIQLSLFQGSLARKLRCHILHFHFFLREVSHDSFVLTSSTFTFWGTSRTTVSFSHLALSLFEGRLARELHFHIFHFHFLRDVSHDSFVLTSCTFTFWGKSRTRAPFSYLPLSLFEGSFARKLRFHIFHVHFLRKVSHEMCFWKFAGARNAVFCWRKRVPEDGWGNLSGWQVRNTFVSIGIMLGSAARWNWQFRCRFANVLARTSIVFCNSAFANRIVMAASRLPGAEAACVILLSFAAGHRKSHLVWLHQVGDRDLSAEFLNFGADDFPFKIPFKKCFNIVFFCFGVEIHPVLELEFLTRLRVVLLCLAWQIAL